MPVTVEFYFECVVRIILYFTLTLSPKHTVWTDQETHVHVSGDSVVGVYKPSVWGSVCVVVCTCKSVCGCVRSMDCQLQTEASIHQTPAHHPTHKFYPDNAAEKKKGAQGHTVAEALQRTSKHAGNHRITLLCLKTRQWKETWLCMQTGNRSTDMETSAACECHFQNTGSTASE